MNILCIIFLHILILISSTLRGRLYKTFYINLRRTSAARKVSQVWLELGVGSATQHNGLLN